MFENIFNKYVTAKNVIFLVIAVLFLLFITQNKDIAILFFASYVIACSLNPIVNKLEGKIKRGPASALVLLGAVIICTVLFIPLIVFSGHEIKSFVDHIPQYIENVKSFIARIPFINSTQAAQFDIGAFISSASVFTTKFVNQSISASVNVASAFIYLIVATIIIYYFMADKEIVKTTYLSLFPSNMKQKADEIITTISQKIGGYVIAQIATMSSVGIIMAVGLAICGIEYAVLLGLITAILDIVPIVGPAIALIVCIITTYKAGALSILLVIIVFAAAQIAENNLVRPYIFSKILDVHPLIIYLFLLLTARIFGIVGVVFAPAIAATVCVLIQELYIKNIND